MLELPTKGQISIQGETIAMKPDGRGGLLPANSAQLRRIRTRLAMVFQSFNLWQHMTVLGNIIEAPVQVMGVKRAMRRLRAPKNCSTALVCPTSGMSIRPFFPVVSNSVRQSPAHLPWSRK
jgi:ABC-type histidine transport system ATPase subunit